MGNLTFGTQSQAQLAQDLISKEMGLPKYGLRVDGTPNLKVIIDTYAIPQNENSVWSIPDTQNGWIKPSNWDELVAELPLSETEIVESLITAADAFGLNGFIDTFFLEHRTIIFEYEMNGGSGLYDLFDNATEAEYPDLYQTNEGDKTPRDYALELLG